MMENNFVGIPKLEEYYQRYTNQLCTYTCPIKETWLMDNGTIMKMKLDVAYGSDYKLDIIIPEIIRKL
jgi:hypothetical protein